MGLQVDYKYNIRGWLTAINDPGLTVESDRFGLQLYYNRNTDGSTAYWNGNIRAQKWANGGRTNQINTYTYDPVNRITSGNYPTGSSPTNSFASTYGYDKNGNFSSLTRKGFSGAFIDQIAFGYKGGNSNRLDYATDASGDIAGVEDFPGTLTGANHYLYDANGNLRRDDYRALNLYYNSFNLPWELDFGNNKKVIYIYDGAGQKIAKEASDGINPAVHTDYLGQFVHGYTVGGTSSLKYIITPEGRLKNKGTDAARVWEWEYNLTDHLGNVRVVFRPGTSNTAEVVEYNNYFPFGMKMTPYLCQTTTDNKYLYNGKELQTDFGLNMYDYGARFYDPALGRWHSVDPLAESYYSQSPYHFSGNNPIKFIDLNGMNYDEYNYYEDDNRLEKVSSKGGDKVQYVNFVDSEGNVNEQVSVKGKTAHVTELRDGYAVTNFDPEIPDNYNENSGYEYSQADFKERKKITDTGNNPITTALENTEKSGGAGPVHAKEYWNKYGHTLGSMMLMESYVGAALDITDVGSLPMGKAAGFRMKSSAKQTSTGSSSSNMSNSWNKFLSTNTGKYSGKNWIKQATKDYYKSSFYNTK